MNRYLVMMLVGGLIMLAGIASTAYTLVLNTEEGVNIGGPVVTLAGLFLVALGGALGGE